MCIPVENRRVATVGQRCFRRPAWAAAQVLMLAFLAVSAQAQIARTDATTSNAKVSIRASLDAHKGHSPESGVILATDGNFYGTAQFGGRHGQGTVFRIKPGGARHVLHAFKGGSDGVNPMAALIQGSDGALYGTSQGNYEGGGRIFRLTLDGGFSVLHVLKVDGSQGSGWLTTPLIQARDGNFYGTTPMGGAGNVGVLYKVTPTGDFSVLASLSTWGPFEPSAEPLEGDDGSFYVPAFSGGFSQSGGLLKIDPDGRVTTLYEFAGRADGGAPSSNLVYDAAHEYMYGACYVHGIAPPLIYRYRANAVETVVELPADGLVNRMTLGPDGLHFYGVNGNSMIESFAWGEKARQIAMLPSTTGNHMQLIFTPAGAMYGTTYYGGTENLGAVFRVTNY